MTLKMSYRESRQIMDQGIADYGEDSAFNHPIGSNFISNKLYDEEPAIPEKLSAANACKPHGESI